MREYIPDECQNSDTLRILMPDRTIFNLSLDDNMSSITKSCLTDDNMTIENVDNRCISSYFVAKIDGQVKGVDINSNISQLEIDYTDKDHIEYTLGRDAPDVWRIATSLGRETFHLDINGNLFCDNMLVLANVDDFYVYDRYPCILLIMRNNELQLMNGDSKTMFTILKSENIKMACQS